jgi:hypothetical protein
MTSLIFGFYSSRDLVNLELLSEHLVEGDTSKRTGAFKYTQHDFPGNTVLFKALQ